MNEPASATVVVLAYGPEPHLLGCIEALLASRPVPEIVIVDNGASAAVETLPSSPLLKIVSPGRNLGFAAGCHVGVAEATSDVVVFVNSDARVAPDAISVIAAAVADPAVGVASASIRLATEPELINSSGNPVHYLCFSWVGGYRDPASHHAERTMIMSFSGATFGMRMDVWKQLGGFDPTYFAYGEDLDLSLRAWQAGYRVVYIPEAVSWHWYEFDRNLRKMYLLERNRLVTMLTVFETGTLLRIAPVAVLIELAVFVAAVRDGWGWQKVRGWVWVARHPRWLFARRKRVQAARTVSDATMIGLFQGTIDPPPELGLSVPAPVNRLLASYWRRVSRALRERAHDNGLVVDVRTSGDTTSCAPLL